MASFCYDCIKKTFPTVSPDRNDLRHDSPGELQYDVCEGCGAGWFDWEGKRVDPPRNMARPKKGDQ